MEMQERLEGGDCVVRQLPFRFILALNDQGEFDSTIHGPRQVFAQKRHSMGGEISFCALNTRS